mmetsp:Transcript_9726/g.23797  ORF Transcript_9726/g.23797 Transcript_9726/m.23797 type:complete len:209 (+) Transcript_9726:877-1503(+)
MDEGAEERRRLPRPLPLRQPPPRLPGPDSGGEEAGPDQALQGAADLLQDHGAHPVVGVPGAVQVRADATLGVRGRQGDQALGGPPHPRRPAQHPGHGDVLHKHHDGASRAAPRAPARPDREARLRHGRGWDDVVPNRPAQRRRDLHAGQGSYGRPQRMEQQHLGASREGGTDVPPDPQGAVHLHAPGQVSLITSLGQVSLISYPVSDQ